MIGAAAISMAALTSQLATAAVPSVGEVGGNYGKYVIFAELAASTSTAINPNRVLNATLPYGTNAGYYSYFSALYLNAQLNAQFTSQSIDSFYLWLGQYYAYQNYQYPSYGDNLQAFYIDYGQDQSAAYIDSVTPAIDYYQDVADYYDNLIFP